MSTTRRIVIKLGTNVLTGSSRHLNHPRMVELIRQCAELQHAGHEIIITSSGAIAIGRERLGFPDLPPSIVNKQLFAAVGQSRLMQMWERYFEIFGIHVGQILLTRADVHDRQRYLNARDALNALIAHRIVPIINENDAVAIEEIKVGDNDNLSALVATLANADLLLILTDQPGLFTADPRLDPDAELISEVHRIDADLRANAGDTQSGLGVGGMATKLDAANVARHAGAEVIICSGSEPDVITRVVAGEAVGTRFPAIGSNLESRKLWILAGPKPAGKLEIDDGAVRALCHEGRSLLPAGVVAIQGEFQRGDTVAIFDGNQHELARGIVAYPSQDVQAVVGLHSDLITDRLGYTYGPEIVHRNNMILLSE